MTVFFSVDVETTGTNPVDPTHHLTSVGAIVVYETGLLGPSWYCRIDYPDEWGEGTREWWLSQNKAAKQEQFTTDRADPKLSAIQFVQWVESQVAEDEEAIFVANPATFDYAWVLRWLTVFGIQSPFHYRTMCLRSADWGRNPGQWGLPRDGHKSVILHHALADAQAQAMDLVDLLRRGEVPT